MQNQPQPMLRNNFDAILMEAPGIALTDEVNESKICPYCKEQIHLDAIKCRYCQSMLRTAQNPGASDGMAIFLAVILGVVGLWYKGQWAAGFAWLGGSILLFIVTGGIGLIFVPFIWIGIIIHAGAAKDRN